MKKAKGAVVVRKNKEKSVDTAAQRVESGPIPARGAFPVTECRAPAQRREAKCHIFKP
jgi:hypothetical protein